MALDTEGRALGIRSILRRLRGGAPRPLSPEDQVEGFMNADQEGQRGQQGPEGANPLKPQVPGLPGQPHEEDEEALKGTSPGQQRAPQVSPRTAR